MLRPRQSDVLSLFGATPEQIRQRQLESNQALLESQQSGFGKTGAALGLGLASLFGGKSQELQQAEQRESVVQEQLAKENELMQMAEQEAQERERPPTALPSSVDFAMQEAQRYTALANRFRQAGTPSALENAQRAEELAMEARVKASELVSAQESAALTRKKDLADLALTQARTADLLKEDVTQAEYRDTNVLAPDGSMVRGTRKDGVLYITDSQTGEEIKAPPNYLLISDTVDPRGQITEQGLRASTFIVKNTPYYKQYESFFGDDKEAQNALVAEFTRLRLDNRNQNVPTNTLVRQAAAFNAGKLKEVTRDGVTYLVDITDPSNPVTLRRK